MIESKIQTIIQEELKVHKQEGNVIIRDFPSSLLSIPIKRQFYNDWSKEIEDYWIVFDEMPNDNKEGYLIIYDDSLNEFGLATKTSMTKDKGMFIGLHGSFIDAFIGM